MVSSFSCDIDLCYLFALIQSQPASMTKTAVTAIRTQQLHTWVSSLHCFSPYYCGTNFCRDTVMVSHHDNTIGKAVQYYRKKMVSSHSCDIDLCYLFALQSSFRTYHLANLRYVNDRKCCYEHYNFSSISLMMSL